MSRYTAQLAIAALILLAWGSSASAQSRSSSVDGVTVDISLDPANEEAGNQRYTINLEDCRDLVDEDEFRFQWTFAENPPSGAQYTIKIREGTEDCALSSLVQESTDQCQTLSYARQVNLTNRTLTVEISQSDLLALGDAGDCEDTSAQIDVVLIFTSFSDGSSSSDDDDSSDDTDRDEVRFIFDTSRPTAPGGVAATGGETSILVSWNEVTDAERYTVYYSTNELTGGAVPEDLGSVNTQEVSGTSESVDLDDGVIPNQVYYIGVTVDDDTGNQSLLSQVVSVTTQPVTDFYELYRLEGGGDLGGYCSAVESRKLPWGGVLGCLFGVLVLGRRRVRGGGRT